MRARFHAASAALVSLLAACDFSYGHGDEPECNTYPGGTYSRTELALDVDVSVDGRSSHIESNVERIDEPPFHLNVFEGGLLNDVSGYFCGEPEGVRSPDRDPLVGSFDVRIESGRRTCTLDTHVDSARLALRLVFDRTTTTSESPPYTNCY